MQSKELTHRQQQCVDRRARHFTNKEIAHQLSVSPATVAMHLRMAREKLENGGINDTVIDHATGDLSSPEYPKRPQAGNESLLWSDFLAKAVALSMLWLTILAVLVVITIPLID